MLATVNGGMPMIIISNRLICMLKENNGYVKQRKEDIKMLTGYVT